MNPRRFVLLLTATVSAWFGGAHAQTITVTTRNDDTDFSGAQQLVNLPGPDGVVSFREAVLAANNTPGPQTIAFGIPAGSTGWSGGVILLQMDIGAFVLNDDETTIDGATQTALTGDTNPNGGEVGIQAAIPLAGIPAIIVNADRCLIRGLDRIVWAGHGVEITGNDNRVVGCSMYNALYAAVNVEGQFGGPVARGNIIGGTGPGEGNSLGGVSVLGGTDNTTVIGNVIRGNGVRIEGATQYNALCGNVRVGGPTPQERNVITGAGGFGEEGFPTGVKVSVRDAFGVRIENNYVGTNVSGTAAETPRAPVGVGVTHSRDVTIRDNLISGIAVTGVNHYAGQRFGAAIAVSGTSINTQIYGNRLGTDVTGTLAIPNLHGIVVEPALFTQIPSGTRIGGTLPGEANLIAFNESTGVRIHGIVTGVPIRGNSIHSNGGLGIDLLTSSGATGITPNDVGDDDAGGNNLQNHPDLAMAESDDLQTRITGTLNSRPNATYTLDFYHTPVCDPSGIGEGQNYVGSTVVTTNAAGDVSFEVFLDAEAPVGSVLTATASDESGNSSEFSRCISVTQMAQQIGDLNCDGVASVGDIGAFVLALTNPSGYAAQFPNCTDLNGDVNQDGTLSVGDIGAFVALLTG